MLFIRQGATHKVVVGPAVAVGDGFTPVTNLAVSSADEAEAILHDNGTVVDIAAYTFAAITTADGYYHLTLQSGISGTVGHMTIAINDDSLILPLRQDFTVLEEAVYDAMYAASAVGPLLATSNGSGLTEAGGTGDHLTAINLPNQTMDITGNITGNLSGSVGSVTTVSDKTGYALSSAGVTAVWAEVMEGAITAVQLMRGFASALLGKASGLGTSTAVFRDLGDAKDRITATVDADGNRTAVTRDLT